MTFLRWLPACVLLTALPVSAGTPNQAAAIKQEYKLSQEAWTLKMKLATTPEARAEAARVRPDNAVFAKRMWECLKPSLSEDWTLEPVSWLLQLAPAALVLQPDGTLKPALPDMSRTVCQAIEKYHLRSPKLAPVCLALASSKDTLSLSLLEKIAGTNPDPKVQGVAALAQAIALKGMSDDTEAMRRRLTLLRKAIINSADIEVDGVLVAKIAEDELYVILHLAKGRVAPDLSGTDSGGRTMKLSDHEGKVIVLLFWNTGMAEPERTLEMAAAWQEKFKGKPFVVIGVNNDPVDTLRKLQAGSKLKPDDDHETTIAWPNFSDPTDLLSAQYRVGFRPLAYVLDGERKIRYSGTPGSFVELTAEAVIGEIKPTEDVAPPAGAAPGGR